MHKLRLLDTFCCAGGAGMGYHLAGFDVTGIDNRPQPRYPFRFIQADALEYIAEHGREYDVIHASPPCQAYSVETAIAYRDNHPKLIDPVRNLLVATGKPYIIENVEGARKHLINPIMLCGSMFGLTIWRHRYFETWPFWHLSPASCQHNNRPILITGTTHRTAEKRREFTVDVCRQAIEYHWMTRRELDEATPPAFTEWLGKLCLASLK